MKIIVILKFHYIWYTQTFVADKTIESAKSMLVSQFQCLFVMVIFRICTLDNVIQVPGLKKHVLTTYHDVSFAK